MALSWACCGFFLFLSCSTYSQIAICFSPSFFFRVAQKNVESLHRKNVQLQELVDIHSQQQESSTSSSQIRTSTELGLSRMNEQLRSELDQRSRMADKDREKARSTLRDLDSVNAQCYKLQQQLGQRENQIKSTLSKLEVGIFFLCSLLHSVHECAILFCF